MWHGYDAVNAVQKSDDDLNNIFMPVSYWKFTKHLHW